MKVAIVSGGSRGLGLELIKGLHKKGFYVCNIARNKEELEKVDKELASRHKYFVGDVSDEKFVISAVEEISKLGEIECLINNAGAPSFKLPTENTAADVDTCFAGLKGMILLSAQVLKCMESGGGGKIINIMSSAALRGNRQESAYCACKWGERGFTESLKVAYSGTKIHIHGIYPGGIDTDFYRNSRDYVSLEKQHSFMPAKDLAEVILDNIFNDKKLIVEDLVINRLK